jgi:hypothetical protein
VDQLTQSTLDHYLRNKVYEQVDYSMPLLKNFRANKRMYPGGTEIKGNAVFGQEHTQDLITDPEQRLTFNRYSPLKQFRYTWEVSHMGFSITYLELLNAGFNIGKGDSGTFAPTSGQDMLRIQDYLGSKLRQFDYDFKHSTAKERLMSNGLNGFPGLPTIISSTPAIGATGSLSRAQHPHWRNRALVGADKIAWSTTTFSLSTALREEYRELRRYAGPTKHVAYVGKLFLKALQEEVYAKGQLSQTGFANGPTDIGVDAVKVNGLVFNHEPMFDDIGLEAFCYIVDHENIRLYVHSGADEITYNPTRPHDQLVHYKSLVWTGALVATRLNSSGVYEVNTAGL